MDCSENINIKDEGQTDLKIVNVSTLMQDIEEVTIKVEADDYFHDEYSEKESLSEDEENENQEEETDCEDNQQKEGSDTESHDDSESDTEDDETSEDKDEKAVKDAASFLLALKELDNKPDITVVNPNTSSAEDDESHEEMPQEVFLDKGNSKIRIERTLSGYKCPTCFNTFAEFPSLVGHRENGCSSELCPLCDFDTNRKAKLATHLKLIHKVKLVYKRKETYEIYTKFNFDCRTLCVSEYDSAKNSKSKNALDQIKKKNTVTNVGLAKNNKDFEQIDTETEFEKKKNILEKVIYPCEVCGSPFKSTEEVKIHQMISSCNHQTGKCPICDFTSPSSSKLTEHVLIWHP